MKKLATIVLLLAVSMGVQAQNAQVAKIRKMYADAKERMANRKKLDLPSNEMVVTSNYVAIGTGPTKEDIHYFYSDDYDGNLCNVVYTPYFITRKRNAGAREYYEEFLFDKGSLMFYFCKSQNVETRYYWSPGGFFHEVIKGEKQMDEVFAARLANDLKDAFDKLMNREL